MTRTLITLVLLGWTLVSEATAVEPLFKAANEAYAAKDYPRAKALYDSIYLAGWESAALHYNLGNTYFQKGEIARAILHYEKALRIDPHDPEIQHNLELARQKTVDRFERLPPNLFDSFRLGIIELFHPDSWALISLLLLALGLGGLALYFHTKAVRWGFGLASLGFVLGLFASLLAWQHQRYRDQHQEVILMELSCYAKNGPGREAEDLFILHAGTKAEAVEAFEEWVKLRLPDGKRGWVPNQCIEPI